MSTTNKDVGIEE